MRPPQSLPLLRFGGGPLRREPALALEEALGERLALLPHMALLRCPGKEGEVWALVPETPILQLPLRPGALDQPEVRGALALVGKVFSVEGGDWGSPLGWRVESQLEMADEEAEVEGEEKSLLALARELAARPDPARAEKAARAMERAGWNPGLLWLAVEAFRRERLPRKTPEALAGRKPTPPPPAAWDEVPEALGANDWSEFPAVLVRERNDPLLDLRIELLAEAVQEAMEADWTLAAGVWRVRGKGDARRLGLALAGALEALEWLRDTWGDPEDEAWPEEMFWRNPPSPPPPEALEARRGRGLLLPFQPSPPPARPDAGEEALMD